MSRRNSRDIRAYSASQLKTFGCGDASGIRKYVKRNGIEAHTRMFEGNPTAYYAYDALKPTWRAKIDAKEAAEREAREREEIQAALKDHGIEPPPTEELPFDTEDIEAQAIAYSDAPDYNRRKFEKYGLVLKFCNGYEGQALRVRIGEWNAKHPSMQTSYPAVMKERKKVREQGQAALLGQFGNRKGASKTEDSHQEYFNSLYLKQGGPSAESCRRQVAGKYGINQKSLPSADTFLRRLYSEVGISAIYMAREGFAKWNRKYGQYIDRDYSKIKAGEVWVSDHAQIDVAVIAASPLITPESKVAFARGFQRLCGLTVQRYRLRLQPPLTASEKRRLERYRAGNHKKHSAKAAAILMIAKGLSMLEIGLEVNAPVRTIYRWFSEFKAKRLDSIETHMVKKIRLEEWELRKTRIIDIVHKMPALYGINRSTWTYSAIAEAYVKEYMVPMSESKVQRAIKETGYTWRHARKVLTSPDLHYREKVERLLQVLSQLKREEAFFFIDEVGPYRVKRYGGVHLAPPGAPQTVPEFQKSKGRVQFVAALEAMSNQLTWLFCEKKGSESLVALLVKLVNQYSDRTKVYLTWDAIGVHSAKNLKKWIDDHNSAMTAPVVEVVPLPANAQFLNVIEAVFGGMKRAVICNSDYQSSQEMQDAIAKHFEDRNCYYRENPKRAGDKIWDKERFDLDKLPGGLFKKM